MYTVYMTVNASSRQGIPGTFISFEKQACKVLTRLFVVDNFSAGSNRFMHVLLGLE